MVSLSRVGDFPVFLCSIFVPTEPGAQLLQVLKHQFVCLQQRGSECCKAGAALTGKNFSDLRFGCRTGIQRQNPPWIALSAPDLFQLTANIVARISLTELPDSPQEADQQKKIC